jgi:sugar lactone lactonase YvrE
MTMHRTDGQLSPPFAGRCIGSETCELGEGITDDPVVDTAWWFGVKGATAWEDTNPSLRLRYPNSGRTFEIAASARGRFEPTFIL